MPTNAAPCSRHNKPHRQPRPVGPCCRTHLHHLDHQGWRQVLRLQQQHQALGLEVAGGAGVLAQLGCSRLLGARAFTHSFWRACVLLPAAASCTWSEVHAGVRRVMLQPKHQRLKMQLHAAGSDRPPNTDPSPFGAAPSAALLVGCCDASLNARCACEDAEAPAPEMGQVTAARKRPPCCSSRRVPNVMQVCSMAARVLLKALGSRSCGRHAQ